VNFFKRFFRGGSWVPTRSERIGLATEEGAVAVWFHDLGRGVLLDVEDCRELRQRLLAMEIAHLADPKARAKA
jgi:hypothetical protein